MKKASNFLYFIVTFIFLSFANFYFANLIVKKIEYGWIFTSEFLNITYAENTGAAFNIFDNSNNFLAFFSILIIFIIFLYLIKNLDKTSKKFLLLLSFLTSGVFGNLFERLAFGHVRDFFELTFINFPIFNISDIFITIAVTGLIISIIFTRKL